MAISVRLRGKVWHARGTVRIGREIVTVPEFSTGSASKAGAVEAAEAEARRIREERLDGATGRARRLTVADCLEHYTGRPGGLQPYDEGRVFALNEVMGHRPLSQVGSGWQDWLAAHPNASPGTVQRWRTILMAALRAGCEKDEVPVPRLPTVKLDRQVREAYLTANERERLLASYTPHAACPALLLSYQGLRTQEALRLDWRSVDLVREVLHIPSSGTKSGRGRHIPMHPRVMRLLVGMAASCGHKTKGAVFLSSRGEPYQDTRGVGGNPLKKQHERACKLAGITDFRVHDHRHDWAARCVMSGMDLYTLMKLGGWTSLRMVERYAGVSPDHMREAVRRVA